MKSETPQPSAAQPLKVYIAAPFPIRDRAVSVMHVLELKGIEVTSRWLKAPDTMTDEHARKDLDDVAAADVLLALNPDGWEERGTGGRHVELGYALALGKPVLLVGERSNIFHHLACVTQIDEIADFTKHLKRLAEVQPPAAAKSSDSMERVDRMIADTAHQMTIGTALEREFFRGWNSAYQNVRNMLNEAKPRTYPPPDVDKPFTHPWALRLSGLLASNDYTAHHDWHDAIRELVLEIDRAEPLQPAAAAPPIDLLDLEPIKRRILIHDEEIENSSEISYAEWEENNDYLADNDVKGLLAEVERLRGVLARLRALQGTEK